LVIATIQGLKVEVVGPPSLQMEKELTPLVEAKWKVVVEELNPCFFLCMSKLLFFSIPFSNTLSTDLIVRVILL
jgi:hypothetical protein